MPVSEHPFGAEMLPQVTGNALRPPQALAMELPQKP